jgi:hypothetical protein
MFQTEVAERLAANPEARVYQVIFKAAADQRVLADEYAFDIDAQTFTFTTDDQPVFEVTRDQVFSITDITRDVADYYKTGQFAERLGDVLEAIEAADTDYDTRYGLVLDAMALARKLRIPTGIRIDEKQPEWPTVFIELPTGQVSWHMPQHPTEFDGHDTAEKYARCRAYADLVGA